MEAMKINFHIYGSDAFAREAARYAVRVFVGGINALSGEPVKADMSTVLKRLNGIERTQDYLYLRGGDKPAQQWLDGISIAPGIVRQFVTVPHTSPASVEHQIMGSATVGGIQLEIIPQHQLGRFRLMRRDHHPLELRYYGQQIRAEYRFPQRLESPSDLGIPLHSRIHARELCGPSRMRTLLDELDWAESSNRSQRTVELQLWPPRPSKKKQKTNKYRNPPHEQGLSLSVFPQTTLAFVRDQVAHTLSLPPELWTIRPSGTLSDPSEDSTTMREAKIRAGQVLFLVPQEFVGDGRESNYSPLMDLAGGAKLRQQIVPAQEDPRSWSVNDACLINVQIMDAMSFRATTGLEPPASPISFDTFLERGIPFAPDCSVSAATLNFGLNRINPAEQILQQAQSADARANLSTRKMPGN